MPIDCIPKFCGEYCGVPPPTSMTGVPFTEAGKLCSCGVGVRGEDSKEGGEEPWFDASCGGRWLFWSGAIEVASESVCVTVDAGWEPVDTVRR